MPRYNLGLMLFLVNLPNFLVKGAPFSNYLSSVTQLSAKALHGPFVKRLNRSLLQTREISGIKAFVETPRNALGRGKHVLLLFLIQNVIPHARCVKRRLFFNSSDDLHKIPVHSYRTRPSLAMNEPDWDPNNLQHDAFTTESSPTLTEDNDVSKWERMYYAPLQEQSQVQTPLLTSNEPFSSSKPTSSDIRIITFDLDNTLWKTGPTISHANAVLNKHLQEAYGVKNECLVEVEMGRLFELDKRRYAGGNFVDEDIDSALTNNYVGRNKEEEYANSVINVGETKINRMSENKKDDDGVIGGNVPKDNLIHIRSASKKKIQPVYLTSLRKDAIRSLIQYNTTTITPTAAESLENKVDASFQLWMDARTESIAQNYASNVLSTLSKLRSSIKPVAHYGKLYIGAITDGNSDPMRVPHLSNYFDFVIRAEDVGVSKPDGQVYKAAVAEVIVLLTRNGLSVEGFFLGKNGDGLGTANAADTTSYIKAPSSSCNASWKDVDQEAIEAFSEAVGPWWVHVGDDFFKDVVASKVFQMRSVWIRELIAKRQTNIEEEKETKQQQERTVEDLENEIAKQKGVLLMSIGESEFLKTSLHEEFSDAVLERFDELSDLLIGWHEDGLREQQAAKVDEHFEEIMTASVTLANAPQWEYSAERDDQISNQSNIPITADATEFADKRKFCVFCGDKLPAVAKFCSGCGEKQP